MENKPVKYDPECKLWNAVLNEQIKSSDLDKNGNPRDSIRKKIENNENDSYLSNKILTPYQQQIKPRMSISLPNKSEFKVFKSLNVDFNNKFEMDILKKEINDIEFLYKIIDEQQKEIYNLKLEKKNNENKISKLKKIINILTSTIKYLSKNLFK
jgi:hypothetical protein